MFNGAFGDGVHCGVWALDPRRFGLAILSRSKLYFRTIPNKRAEL